MPRYDYVCLDCDRIFEAEHSMLYNDDVYCKCGGLARKVIRATKYSWKCDDDTRPFGGCS